MNRELEGYKYYCGGIKCGELECGATPKCPYPGYRTIVGKELARPIGVTDNFGVIAKPNQGMKQIQVVDDFGAFIGWTMGSSYA